MSTPTWARRLAFHLGRLSFLALRDFPRAQQRLADWARRGLDAS